ncbi:hypothetical protein [Emticicia agri]|uniref:Uncharacterized protein n=1 Tax=Emticicia agri TaxID=2492393 RepID=A0A4Q5LT77_9BACT|nr:hypothetical protein [Emticicia agri]RYU92697.1 hypothetical protein EWM59_25820 [Emticicia agri]
MLYKALFHCCYVIISFVTAAIFAMAMYTFELGKLTLSFYAAFALLEGLHIVFVVQKQFRQKQRALLLNHIHFIVMAIVSLFVLYFYSNLNSWRNAGDNSIEFRTFSYFFDNIFLINFAFFFVNFWFLCRNLIIWSFRRPMED